MKSKWSVRKWNGVWGIWDRTYTSGVPWDSEEKFEDAITVALRFAVADLVMNHGRVR